MSTVNPNASVSQSQGCCCGCGGASNTAAWLNAIGRWGTVLTGTLQGKPVATGRGGTQVGAKGQTSLQNRMSGASLIMILLIVAVFIFLLRK